MKKTELLSRDSATGSIAVSELSSQGSNWLFDCDYCKVSSATLARYRIVLENLVWFLQDRSYTTCGKRELQEFVLYLRDGHKDPRGRWGNTRNKRETRPGTIVTYFTLLRTFFRYLVQEGCLAASPLRACPARFIGRIKRSPSPGNKWRSYGLPPGDHVIPVATKRSSCFCLTRGFALVSYAI